MTVCGKYQQTSVGIHYVFSSVGHLVLIANSRSGDVAVIRTTSYSPQGPRKIGALFTMLPAAKHPNAIAVKAFQIP